MILLWVIWTILSLIAFLILLLFLPWRVAFAGTLIVEEGNTSGQGAFNIGGKKRGLSFHPYPKAKLGVGNYDHPFLSFHLPWKKEKIVKGQVPKPSSKKRRIPYLRIFKSVLKKVHFDECRLMGSFGLPNPMYTGWVMGSIKILSSLVKGEKAFLNITPRFNNRIESNLSGNVSLRFQPLLVAWQATKSYYKFRT